MISERVPPKKVSGLILWMFRRFVCISLSIVLLAGCRWDGDPFSCSTSVEREYPSPDGTHIAIVYHRDCGATTDFNTQVGLRLRTERLDLERAQVVAVAGQHPVTPVWSSNRRLVIPLPNDQIYVQSRRWCDVEVSYAAMP